MIHYPIAPHRQAAYREFADKAYPLSEKIHQEVLSLPIGPHITMEDVGQVAKYMQFINGAL